MSQDDTDGGEWWRGAVLYQIYPRSFRDADGDGVGDLAGVIEKLDHVASLGVAGVWLSPFFPSPMKDFGYDVSDYTGVDPLFGSLADFDRLVARAHALGLKVIIDQVWAHTSDRHPWFVDSAASQDDPKADWYVWADAREDGAPPNNWLAAFGGPSWTWGPRRRQYYLHNFLAEQPDLNYWQPEVQAAVLEAGRFWLDRGVDGFRLDVINYLFHDRALTDNPVAAYVRTPALPTRFQRHTHDRTRPETLAFIARLRALLDSYPARMAVGEVVDDPPLPRQIEYTDGPDRLHTAYSFHFLDARAATPALFEEAIASWQGAAGWPSWSLGNHDVARFATRLAHDDPAHARVLMAVLMCLPGTVFLYQGDELGLPQAQVPFDRLRDPFAISAWTGGAGRDGARTPMPWTAAGVSAGFSAAVDTWLPIDERHRALAVDVQDTDEKSVLTFTRRLVTLRGAQAALRLGETELVPAPEGVLAFIREKDGGRLACVFELAGRQADAQVEAGAQPLFAVTGAEKVDETRLRLPPFGGAVLRLCQAGNNKQAPTV